MQLNQYHIHLMRQQHDRMSTYPAPGSGSSVEAASGHGLRSDTSPSTAGRQDCRATLYDFLQYTSRAAVHRTLPPTNGCRPLLQASVPAPNDVMSACSNVATSAIGDDELRRFQSASPAVGIARSATTTAAVSVGVQPSLGIHGRKQEHVNSADDHQLGWTNKSPRQPPVVDWNATGII